MSGVHDAELVQEIKYCTAEDSIRVHTNGGHMDFDKKGILKFFDMPVFVNTNSLANILSLKDVTKRFRVTMESEVEKAMLVHVSKDKAYKFRECGQGLYFLDVHHPDTVNLKITKSNVNEYSFLNTVATNKEYFTRTEIKGADCARELQQTLGWPSDQALISSVQNNLIMNCPITEDDIRWAKVV